MNEDDKETFQHWLSTKGFKGACTCCGASRWIVGELITSHTLDDSSLSLGRPDLSMAQLVCENCSFIMLFGASQIGLGRN